MKIEESNSSPVDTWLVNVVERWYLFGKQTAFEGKASLIIFNSIFSAFLGLEMLLFDDVLRDEWLVPDENDDPRDTIESFFLSFWGEKMNRRKDEMTKRC